MIDTFIGFSKVEVEASIPERFEKIVNHYSDRQAVKGKNSILTYRELNQSVNQLAHAILDKRGRGEEPIILICDHDVAVIIGIMGILKTGKAYVSLNPDTPLTRLNYILKDLEAKLIITDKQNLTLVKQLAQHSVSIMNVDEMDQSYPQENLNIVIAPNSLCNIVYTSGSTGQPKGVMRDSRMILHRVYTDTNDLQIKASDRFTMLTSSAFTSSTSDIFNALLTGGTLCVGSILERGLNWLTQWLIDEKITILRLPVSLFQQWIETLTAKDQFPDLRYISPGGKFYKKDIEKIKRHISDRCYVVQKLASSETSLITRLVISSPTEIKGNNVPVGYAKEGKDVFLVDDSGKRLGFNQIGEITVKSRYISQGYWRNPELTNKKFLPTTDGSDERIYLTGDLGRMQPDGCLEWIQRKDFMLKIRGYRVEPSEIEGALLDIEGIRQAVVVGVSDLSGEIRLAAYIVPKQGFTPEIKLIRAALVEKLPSYMIPSKFVILETLPTTTNSKIDRSKLPPIDWSLPDVDNSFMPPRNSLETEILEIWESVLQLSRISINDNFIELGGSSIQAMQIVSRVLEKFYINLSPNLLLESATVAAMADKIIQYQIQLTSEIDIEKMLDEIEQLP
ncbi:acyl-CoA synthetase (AMP-forming)/AMP-acid ligase II [Synechococcus sp. PCC 7502]|uniref:non-ribosomal peptide synthetase n=1 Tax=Synechococcus sp. PCC 7502 TaxID=1173263 RepID=UPI00029FA7CC|nr:non-ribosomal peptide synthetase [Synechococcus sp. PCC 7502]AFY74911.1 acyl-CoA synthetase (AMP-forming)/AMP-acid ligase II [Synechococcus sp. PCC 7502]